MEDLHHRVIKTLKGHVPGLGVALVREKKHVILDFTLGDKTTRTSISKSPRDEDVEHRNACACICRELGIPKPKF